MLRSIEKQMTTTLKMHYVGFGSRALAYILDAILLSILSTLVTTSSISTGNWRVIFIAAIMKMTAGFLYRPLCHTAFGKTAGKLIVGIRVVKADDTPIGTFRALLREVLFLPLVIYNLIAVPFVITPDATILSFKAYRGAFNSFYDGHLAWLTWSIQLVGFLVFIAQIVSVARRADHKALHDLIAGTAVVSKGRQGNHKLIADDISQDTPCLKCGKTIPGGYSVCEACGWSYDETKSQSNNRVHSTAHNVRRV